MSASNDELLFYAARDGKLEVVKELLSKGTGTGYRDEVSYHILLSLLYLMMMMHNYVCYWHLIILYILMMNNFV